MSLRTLRRTIVATTIGLALAACSGSNPETHIASAKAYLDKRDYPAAIIELKNAIEKAPGNGAARFLLAQAFLDSGNPVAAETEARKAIEVQYSPDQAYPVLAQSLVQQGQWKKVLSDLASAPVQAPAAKAEVKAAMAAASAAEGKVDDAKKFNAEALAADPRNVSARLLQARIQAASGNVAEAIKGVDAILQDNPKSLEALVLKGDFEAASGQPAEARRSYERAIEVAPTNVGARYGLVMKLMEAGQVDAASAHRDELVKQAPNDPRTQHAVAMVEFARGHQEAALAAIQKAAQAAPDYLPVVYLSGLIDLQRGSLATAETSLQSVLAKAPEQDGARRALTQVYLRRGNPAKAMESLEPVLKRHPEDAGALRLAGEIQIALRNPAKSAAYYEKANALDKGNVASAVRLAQVHLAQGDTKGFSELESLAAEQPAGSQADAALITAYLQKREYDKALAAADGLIRKDPKKGIGYSAKGAVLIAKGDLKGARASFDKALEVEPGFRPAIANLVRLDVAQRDFDSAKKRLEALIASNKDDAGAMVALAEILVATNAPPADVTAMLERAIAARPTVPGPRLALINYNAGRKDLKAALGAAQAANLAIPDSPQILEALGTLQQANGETNQALETFKRLTTLAPRNVGAFIRLADAQARTKDYPSALASLHGALAIQPENQLILLALVNTYMQAGTVETGLAEARKLQKDLPTRAAGYALEGELLARTGKSAEAVTVLRNGNTVAPSAASAMRLHAALLAAGKNDEAAAVTAKWNKDHPQDATVRFYLGQVALQKKDYKAAEPMLRDAAALQPDNPAIVNNYAWTLVELNDPKAVQVAERAYARAPKNADVAHTYAMALLKNGKTEQGLEKLRQAVALAPNDPGKRLDLGKALLKSGDKAGARTELEAVAKAEAAAPKAEAEQLLKGM